MDRRNFCLAASALALTSLSARAADTFPSRPVRVIVPYPAGGGPDVQMRQAAPTLGKLLGQQIVIENKVGAAGVLAAQYVAQTAPDGYTLLLGSSTHLTQKALSPDLHFDPIADFTPISNFSTSPTVLVVRADAPYATVEELIAAAKARPGQMNYSSGGIGSAAHLAGATLVTLAGLQVTHIPLKGSVEIATSLIRGDTQFAFPTASTGVPQVKGGKLRALAVTSPKRLPSLPDVPTLYERLKNELTVQESWSGFWAPAKTPASIVNTLYAAVVRTQKTPSVLADFEATGNQAAVSESPQAYAAFVRSESRKWAQIVKLVGLTAS